MASIGGLAKHRQAPALRTLGLLKYQKKHYRDIDWLLAGQQQNIRTKLTDRQTTQGINNNKTTKQNMCTDVAHTTSRYTLQHITAATEYMSCITKAESNSGCATIVSLHIDNYAGFILKRP